MKLVSPAKLNLFFCVLGKRPDGFHEIASLFSAIDLCDSIEIQRSSEDRFFCSEATIRDEENLALLARDRFREKADIRDPVSISLKKNIPLQAGFGGGSSNAATVLWGLNRLFSSPLSSYELWEIAEDLGSDVPFFLSSGVAFCRSRGEEFFDVAPPKQQAFWVLKPNNKRLCTAAVYGKYRSNPHRSRDPYELWRGIERGELSYVNDLEESAYSVDPSLKEIKASLLEKGFSSVCMTGSGPTFFCVGKPHTTINEEEFFVRKVSLLTRDKQQWYQPVTTDTQYRSQLALQER